MFLEKKKKCKMPLKTHNLRTKSHHKKMFPFVLLMGKSMFWKNEIYENTPENSAKYSYKNVFSTFLIETWCFPWFSSKDPLKSVCVCFSKNCIFVKVRFSFKAILLWEPFHQNMMKIVKPLWLRPVQQWFPAFRASQIQPAAASSIQLLCGGVLFSFHY